MKENDSEIEQKYLFKVLNSIDDAIYIADKTGKTLWMNETNKKIFQNHNTEVIGKNVAELEKAGVFNPSIIKKVIETGKSITKVQTLLNTEKYMSTGHPILNDDEEIEYVIAHGRDLNKIAYSTPHFELEEINALLQRYIQEFRKLNKQKLFNEKEHTFIGQSQSFIRLSDIIKTLASVDTTVLITGDTGVGKNVVAQQIHHLSERHDKPFIHVNCAAVPETLIESELFGYMKGAFTGANTGGKVGLVQLAESGTLFLDEISELSFHLQSKLLQLLQNKTYKPIGTSQTKKANIRIIAATNLDLEEMVEKGTFRKDLFYRLNVLPIRILPLRERKEDIFPLLQFYLNHFNTRYKKNRFFTKKVIEILQNYTWPGNVRELENLVEQLVIMAKKDEISMINLPERFHKAEAENKELLFHLAGDSLSEILNNVEKEVIAQAYKQHKTTRKTAKALGVPQSTLMRRLKKYKLNEETN
ncbi:sigma 54-interacting transcriptional regulator [Priestia megaterium]